MPLTHVMHAAFQISVAAWILLLITRYSSHILCSQRENVITYKLPVSLSVVTHWLDNVVTLPSIGPVSAWMGDQQQLHKLSLDTCFRMQKTT